MRQSSAWSPPVMCHTDLSAQAGHLPFPLPGVLGHEGAGVVEQVGAEVTGVEVGDHVLASFSSCGECPELYCRTARLLRPLPRPQPLRRLAPRRQRDDPACGRARTRPLLRPVHVREVTPSSTSAALSRCPPTCRSRRSRHSAAASRPAPEPSSTPAPRSWLRPRRLRRRSRGLRGDHGGGHPRSRTDRRRRPGAGAPRALARARRDSRRRRRVRGSGRRRARAGRRRGRLRGRGHREHGRRSPPRSSRWRRAARARSSARILAAPPSRSTPTS